MDFSWAESADEKLATLASNDFSNYPYCTKSRKTYVLMFSFYHEASPSGEISAGERGKVLPLAAVQKRKSRGR
jgi:hypothetical protein